MIVTGTVADARGRLIAGATLHVYHQDSTGQYMRDHEPARLEARVRTGSDGAYRLLSVVPGGAEGAPHVHFEVEARGHAAQSFVMPVPAKAGQPRGTTSRPLFPSQSPDEALRMRIESTGVSALAAGGLAVSRRDSAGIVLLRYDIRLR
jgi:hypothetical protein